MIEAALIELAVAECDLAAAAVKFAAAHLDAGTDEGAERMFAARDVLFEAVDRVTDAEAKWFLLSEAEEAA